MDEENFHSLLHRPGTLIDIGAHDGLLTIPLARLPGSQVLAFEPLPSAFARLQTALRAAFGGDPATVACHHLALGDHEGSITLAMPVRDGVAQEQWASTAKDYAAHVSARVTVKRFTVPMRTLDDFALSDVTAIKLDAEGADGLAAFLARHPGFRVDPVVAPLGRAHGGGWRLSPYHDGTDGFFFARIVRV
jgi:FkbM family methyltransferase